MKLRRNLIGAGIALAFLAILMAGCGAAPAPPNFPGLAADGLTIYASVPAGQLSAIDAETGSRLWTYPLEPESGLPLVFTEVALGSDGSRLYTGSYDSSLYALTVSEGAATPLWQYETGDIIVGAPAYAEGMVFIGSSDHVLYALDAESGALRWQFETGNTIWAPPLVADGRVYAASMDHSVYALQAETGEQVWEFDGSTGAFAAPPTLEDDTLYIGAFDGQMYALDAETGNAREGFSFQADNWLWSEPVVAEGLLFVGSLDHHLYALDPATGAVRWKDELPGPVRAGVAVSEGTVFVGCEKVGDVDGRFKALDAATGQPRWERSFSASLLTQPVIVGEQVVIVLDDGRVVGLNQESGVERALFTPETQ